MPFLSANWLAFLVELAVSRQSPRLGRAAHSKILRTLHPPLPPFLSTHLINMYSKLDLPYSARLVLQFAPIRNVVSWTALVAGLVQNGHFAAALCDFSSMLREGFFPNEFTFPCAFKAAGSLGFAVTGKQIHALAVKCGRVWDVFVGCSAFDMYCKTGIMDDAKKLFGEIPEKNITTWNAFISNAVMDGRPRNAIDGFMEFRGEGGESNSITICACLSACSDGLYLGLGRQLHGFVFRYGWDMNVSVGNGLIDFYGKCQEVECSERVFYEMNLRNDVSWCSLVVAYVQNYEDEKASVLFSRARKEGFEPTDFMISSSLSACAGMAGLELGRSIHALAVKACVEGNIFVGSALVDMYGKCGSVEDAERAFEEMPQKNLVTLNSMIGGYAHQGHADMAMTLFQDITSGKCGVLPNYVTFVCVLSACSRAGAVEKGMEMFESMKVRYDIEPGKEHYACVVDMLGRAGMVDRAYEFIRQMPIRPTISVWGALLNACRVYGKPELGTIAARNLFKLDPKDSGNHVVLSNMLAAAGRWEEADQVRKELKDVGIKKGAGYSWIAVKNQVHAFQAKDRSHKMSSEIQAMLADLRRHMDSRGYAPDTKLSLYDLEEEEKATEVGHHSEKLALAFGLLALPQGVPIRITKNLRICRDCHSFFKSVSGMVEREIVVRDNNRFHRFKSGYCSCRDYW